MEDEPTQPATQIVLDPRKVGGSNSGLSDEDLADIFCILHPLSIPAYKAASLIHEISPQHTISSDKNVKIREKAEGPQPQHEDIGTFDLAERGITSCDIALRLSADLKNPLGGFLFGRNKSRCDIVLGKDEEVKRVSNIHFKIFINEFGIIMIEDQSTNGTVIDRTLLRAKEKENGKDYRRTLELGTIITLTMTPPEEDFRFLVRIPLRDEEVEEAYQQNLTNYFMRIRQIYDERQARVGGANRDPVDIFANGTPDPGVVTQMNYSISSGRHVREWRGGQKYNKVGTIGKGAFAVVYKITAKYDGTPYAAKELEKRRFMKNGILDQKVDMEMKIMQQIRHPNIVQYIEHVDWDDYLYIIMEYIPGGDLGGLMSRHGSLKELEVKIMASQLLGALKYLHEKGITHRDVKPDNILIHSLDPFQVKLTDFGLSKMVDSEETFLRTFCGTLLYCAPEVYSEYREYDSNGRRTLRGKKQLPPQKYGDAVDIWSLAGVLYYALSGSPPYPAKNGTTYQELLDHIMTQALDIRPLQKAGVSETGIRFVRRMLHIRPEDRATIAELEDSSWLTGGDSQVSIQEDDLDEVDMIGDGFIDPDLEEGASQLSLKDDRAVGDSDVSDLTELRTELRYVIPGNFDTSDTSNDGESYGFMANSNGNGRLFGEVDASALGSSGAIPVDHLPVPRVNRQTLSESDFAQESMYTQNESEYDQSRAGEQPKSMAMPPPPQPPIRPSTEGNAREVRATRSSSLMGAESMVGHLNMHSPSNASSPAADIPTERASEVSEFAISLRRPREDDEYSDRSWYPSDLPAKKKRRSSREVDLPLPVSIFWDPKNRATHHRNYPTMSLSDFKTYELYAAEKGEVFEPGQPIFETAMTSFRTSRSPSLEPEAGRAHSEPTRGEGRRILMKRDERKLSEGSLDAIEPTALPLDRLMPETAHGSNSPSAFGDPGNVPKNEPLVGHDFQPPKRILGKIIATPDSCLPTVSLNVTETVTTWGRGLSNIIRYVNGNDVRVPKYAFKIFLFKQGFYRADGGLPNNVTPGNGKNNTDNGMTFYISTKASFGISINGIKLQSHNPREPNEPSRYWGELHHGDLITVWKHDVKAKQYTRFRFECYWGKSKEVRPEGTTFSILPPGDLLQEIERVCLAQEKQMLAEIKRREEEEAREVAATKPANVTQSFISAPPAA